MSGAQRVDGAGEIDGVPENDGGDHEIEAGSPVALVFESPIRDFAEPMKEHNPLERPRRNPRADFLEAA